MVENWLREKDDAREPEAKARAEGRNEVRVDLAKEANDIARRAGKTARRAFWASFAALLVSIAAVCAHSYRP